ncbi:MAG: DUF952 domain-containing protein [Alphaproteobacteria bacterium]|nr:MAG: DUF952 domain-containing protein [Alphaproteobacteria bacterium]
MSSDPASTPALVFKVLRAPEAAAFVAEGRFAGSADDLRDGFVHLSTREQLPGTLSRHFAGEDGLWLAALATAALGAPLRWEPSRGGALFPHLYRPIGREDLVWLAPIATGPDGPRLPALAG